MRALFVVWSLHFQIALSQFPQHVDFQKEGEVFIKGEKYNILKISKHVVKDHFQNFMQQKEEDPTKRLFLDKNGFRHLWSGFNDDKNLRKSENNIPPPIKDDDSIVTGNIRDDRVHESSKDETKNVDSQTKDGNEPKDEVNKLVVKKQPKRKAKSDVVDKIIMKPALRADDAGKTMAVTYFYCPFFGVMSLSAYID